MAKQYRSRTTHSQRKQQAPPAVSNGAKNGNNAVKTARPAEKFLYFPPERYGLWPTQIAGNAFRPYRLVQRNWREEIPHMVAVFFAVVLLYALTTPRLVALEDDGLFIANLHFWGVAHPPGYPVHTFLGSLFYHLLPFGTPAFKGHFFSGFAGAVGCAAIYATVAMLVRGRIFAYLGGLAYGASDTFWSQAIIAEVYTLNAMFFFIVLALCVRYAGHTGRSGRTHKRIFAAITYVYGLGLATHYPILGLGSIGLGMLVLPQLSNIFPRIIPGLGFIFLGAVPPYLWMAWRSLEPTPANFYGPIICTEDDEPNCNSLNRFLFYIFRKGYSGVDKQAGVGLDDKIAFSEALGSDMLWQFTPLGFIFVVLGFWAMARSRYSWLWLSLAVSWFMSSVLLIYLLDFKAEFIWMAAFRVYHLLAFGIMAIWLALGAAWAVDKLRGWPEMVRMQLGCLITICVVGLSITAHWEKNNRSEYSWAHDLATAKLNSVDPNAILFTFDDLDLPVGYLHFVEGVRPDLKVYNDQGLVYGDRLFSPLIPDHAVKGRPDVPNKAAVLRKFTEANDRPIFYHAARRELHRHPRYGSDVTGFFRRVNRAGPEDRVVLSDALLHWLNKNVGLHDKIVDRWTKQQHYSTVSQLVNAVQLAVFSGYKLDDTWREVIDRALAKNALARLVSNNQKLRFGRLQKEDMERELEWMENFSPEDDELLGRQLRGTYYFQKAFFSKTLNLVSDEEYEAILLEGIAQLESPSNPVAQQLFAHYQKLARHCDFIALVERLYPNTESIPKELLRPLRLARSKDVCG